MRRFDQLGLLQSSSPSIRVDSILITLLLVILSLSFFDGSIDRGRERVRVRVRRGCMYRSDWTLDWWPWARAMPWAPLSSLVSRLTRTLWWHRVALGSGAARAAAGARRAPHRVDGGLGIVPKSTSPIGIDKFSLAKPSLS